MATMQPLLFTCFEMSQLQNAALSSHPKQKGYLLDCPCHIGAAVLFCSAVSEQQDDVPGDGPGRWPQQIRSSECRKTNTALLFYNAISEQQDGVAGDGPERWPQQIR